MFRHGLFESIGERLQARAGLLQSLLKQIQGFRSFSSNPSVCIFYLRKRSMSRAISTSSLVGMFNTVTFAPSEEMIAS